MSSSPIDQNPTKTTYKYSYSVNKIPPPFDDTSSHSSARDIINQQIYAHFTYGAVTHALQNNGWDVLVRNHNFKEKEVKELHKAMMGKPEWKPWREEWEEQIQATR